MSVEACAKLVEAGDPDRYRAAMAAPSQARSILFPLYAFLLEIARAPWVTQEAAIAEIRLQWWRETLSEISTGAPVKAHEVAVPLSLALGPEGAMALDGAVASRRWDIYSDAFDSYGHFEDYLMQTAAMPIWVAMEALGAGRDLKDRVLRFGWGAGLARYLVAVPELEARGRKPLLDVRLEALSKLAEEGLARLEAGRGLRRELGSNVTAPMLEAWTAEQVLTLAFEEPIRVREGRLKPSEFAKRAGLLKWSFLGGL
ncbi:MAG: squalene/phytoene synthase family protein [Pseudomonadota bacterium]